MNEGSFPNFGIRVPISEFSKYTSFAKTLRRNDEQKLLTYVGEKLPQHSDEHKSMARC